MTTSNGSAFASNRSEQARTLFRLARSSSTSSKLPPLAAASLSTCSVAVLALFKSRAAPTTCAPCAARERAVSTPSPAETPVTKIRLPFRFTPDKTSSVVEVAPNEIASSMFVIFCLLSTDRFDVTVHGSDYALAVQRDGICSVIEIVLRIQIGYEPRLNW